VYRDTWAYLKVVLHKLVPSLYVHNLETRRLLETGDISRNLQLPVSLVCPRPYSLDTLVSFRVALPFPQFALLHSVTCVTYYQLRLITILGNCSCQFPWCALALTLPERNFCMNRIMALTWTVYLYEASRKLLRLLRRTVLATLVWSPVITSV
jgi:hypothetical protein